MHLGVMSVRQTYLQTHGRTDILIVNTRLTMLMLLDKNATSTENIFVGKVWIYRYM